jgi:DNA-binding transcriptional LysR family regulator
MKNTDIRQLAMLCTLVECQSPAETARRLEITPSAVSQSLTRLRDIMGDPMVIREGNGWRLTPFGEQAIGNLREIVTLWHALDEEAQLFAPGNSDAHLVLACHDAFGLGIMQDFYRAVLDEAPFISLDLHTCANTPQDMAALRDGSVDLAISPFIELPQRGASDLRSETLASFEITHCCMSASHPRISRSLSMAQYLAESHFRVAVAPAAAATVPASAAPAFAPASGPVSDPIDAALLARGLTARNCSTLNSWTLCAELLAHSTRLVSVTELQARSLTQADARIKAVALPPGQGWPSLAVQMVWHERNTRHLAHRWMRGKLREFYLAEPSHDRFVASNEAWQKRIHASPAF